MASFEPSPQPTGVPPSGAVTGLTVPDTHRHRRIHRIVIEKIAGSATSFGAVLSTDPNFLDRTRLVVSMSGGNGATLDYDNGGNGYEWDAEGQDGELYIRITPDQGTDNDFRVRIYIRRGSV